MSGSPGILAVVNGSASQGSGARAALERALGPIRVIESRQGADLVATVRDAIRAFRPDTVVAAGGDGTISAVISALDGAAIPLGVVPTGTANVFAAEIGVPTSIEAACDIVRSGHTARFDAIEYRERRCVCRVGFGAFGEVGRQTPRDSKARVGALAYAWSAVPMLRDAPIRDFVLHVDGRRVALEASCVVLTNVARVGWADLRWGDSVSANDGVLDLFVVHGRTLGENLRVLWSAIAQDVQQAEDVSHLSVHESLRVEVNASVAVTADGELLSGRDHELRVKPAAIEVFVPVPR